MRISSNRYAAGFLYLLLYSAWVIYQSLILTTTEENVALWHALMNHPRADVKEIISASTHYSFESNESWPSWKHGTIQMQPMLDFVNRLLLDTNQTVFTNARGGPSKQRDMFVETPYVVSRTGILYSHTLKRRNVPFQQKHRILPVEGLMNEALQLLLQSEERNTTWPRLNDLLVDQERSFPFMAFYGDHTSCNYHNYRDEHNVTQSLPLFTFGVKANAMGCWNGFPMASYKMIRDSKSTSDDWDLAFAERDRDFPWHDKVPEAVWRGSLSDKNVAVRGETPRSKLVSLANHEFGNTSLFDVGFSSTKHFTILKTSLEHLVKGTMPFVALQKYVAVIDIDGNAWSSRFPTQLCLNSVTLKVKPRFAEYFMGTQVKPGIHYIPIKGDLSDLLEKTRWVMHHPNETQQIVANARNWCREHMTWKSLARDLLDMWEKYITWLNEHDPEWYDIWERQWSLWNQRKSIFGPIENTLKLSKDKLSGSFPSS